MVQLKPLTVTALLFSLYLFVRWTSAKSGDVHYCNKKANYTVKFSGVEITPYPISRGKQTTISIAAFLGSYPLKMSMVDENKKQLTCITFDFCIGFAASETLASSLSTLQDLLL